MNFNIYINDELGRKLSFLSKEKNKTRNMLIREALEHYLKKTDTSWPQEILSFRGIKDESFRPFESFRSELSDLSESELF